MASPDKGMSAAKSSPPRPGLERDEALPRSPSHPALQVSFDL